MAVAMTASPSTSTQSANALLDVSLAGQNVARERLIHWRGQGENAWR
jgi:hypothetical protein